MARVLVADDDPDIRDLARLLISKHGHQVVTAGDGIEAIAMLTSEAPALVVTDFTMPHKDGLLVLRAVRSMAALQRIPVVLLTALPLTDERVLRASAETAAVLLAKTEISRLGELADSLVSGAAERAIS
jgi:two-component system, cell cycle sensor histidine kinase and response regulator CckA